MTPTIKLLLDLTGSVPPLYSPPLPLHLIPFTWLQRYQSYQATPCFIEPKKQPISPPSTPSIIPPPDMGTALVALRTQSAGRNQSTGECLACFIWQHGGNTTRGAMPWLCQKRAKKQPHCVRRARMIMSPVSHICFVPVFSFLFKKRWNFFKAIHWLLYHHVNEANFEYFRETAGNNYWCLIWFLCWWMIGWCIYNWGTLICTLWTSVGKKYQSD